MYAFDFFIIYQTFDMNKDTIVTFYWIMILRSSSQKFMIKGSFLLNEETSHMLNFIINQYSYSQVLNCDHAKFIYHLCILNKF